MITYLDLCLSHLDQSTSEFPQLCDLASVSLCLCLKGAEIGMLSVSTAGMADDVPGLWSRFLGICLTLDMKMSGVW